MFTTSVIIATYNRADFLINCLFSLIHQSQLPDEIIISDDGSTDDMLDAIRKILPQIPVKLKFVQQENNGFRLAKVRNNGVRASRGDYLVFVDQDLIFTKNFIKTFVKNRKENQFCVSYPVRLSATQSDLLDQSIIGQFGFYKFLKKFQREKIKKQYRKEYIYYILKKLRLRETGPKLRGGAAAINRSDYFKVNGYDEKYQGWGNEDDDMGKRLYRAGVIGKNPFYREFPLHLYHPPHHENGERINNPYYKNRVKEIRAGDFRSKYGIENPLDENKFEVTELN